MLFKSIITVVLAVVAQSSFAAECAREYTVKAGDYCDKISREQKVSTFQLAALNSRAINNACSNLVPGQKLCLGNKGEDCTKIYSVRANDGCSGIAAAHGLNSTIMRLNNPQINDSCNNLYIGEVLCVAGAVEVPPIPSTGVVIPVAGPPAGNTAKPAPTTTVRPTTTAPAVIKNVSTKSATTTKAAAPAQTFNPDDFECEDDDVADSQPTTSSRASAAGSTRTTTSTAASSATGLPAEEEDDLPYCDELEEED